MRVLGLGGVCAIFALCLGGCGSGSAAQGEPDGSMDASMYDAPGPADTGSDGAAVSATCDNAALLAGCTTARGACTVSATGSPLASGASLTIVEKPVPTDLNGDTLGSVLCSISLPSGLTSLSNLNLSIALSAAPAAPLVLFQRVSASLSRLVTTSQALGNAVEGLVTAPGDFGATERPGLYSLQGDVALSVSSSANQASLLQNLSAHLVDAAYYDGTHLFECNGARLLVYNAIPASPSVKPDVILGQSSLDTVSTQTTSSLFGTAGCSAVWSDGTRLVVASGNRILIWNRIPSQNAGPADLVLGQPDFSTNVANNGGVGSASMAGVASVDSDGTRLAAAEISNNRVLVWNQFPVAVDQPADIVVGEPDFTSNTAYGGATPIYQAWGSVFASQGLFLTGRFSPGLVHVATVATNNPAADFTALPISYKLQPPNVLNVAGRVALTPGGGLAVRDPLLNRIDVLKALPTGPATIDFVLGQPASTYVVSSPVSASVVAVPAHGEVGLGAGRVLLAPDSNRLLVFDTPPTYNFEPASRVIGQAGFATNGPVDYTGISAASMAGPADVAVAQGMMAVADSGNNRVLLYRTSDVAAGHLSASVVLGQPDSASYIPNLDQQTPSAARMSGPAGVALDGTHLIVADTENHRVLIWNTVPTTTGAPADVVLGQSGFSGRRPNGGAGDANGDGYSDASAQGMFYPTGVASNGTQLFVADRLNNRILVWSTFPTTNGKAADAVLGQPDFTTSQANRGNGPFTVVANGLNLPTGVTLVGTTLWVADTENNRVVRWDNVTTTPVPAAFVGQASGSVNADPNYVFPNDPTSPTTGLPASPATAATTVLRPRTAVISGGTLYVSEQDSNRVHLFDAASLAPVGELGQSGDTAAGPNANGVDPTSLSTPLGVAVDGNNLWVADSGNHRLVAFDVTNRPGTGASAKAVLGQPNLVTNGFNQSSTAGNGATSHPNGLALVNGTLYVADTDNSRVLAFKTPVTAGQAPVAVYGQPDMLQALPNAGGAPSAKTLSSPHGIFADAAHLIVADTDNNRVLIYDPSASIPSAQVVLGQPDFVQNGANSGGAGASTMASPTAVFTDGTSLWVADTGNHRVLVWKVLPTTSAQPADFVIGQASVSGILPNQGGLAASASSLSFPAGIDVVGGVLYIADTGNNRVVSFSTLPKASGASADGVLGQQDLTSRGPAIVASDLSHLAGPVGVTDDGANLYVTDRDLARVLVYTVGTISSSATSSSVVGSVGGVTLHNPGGIAVERTPFFTSRLYIADPLANEVAVVQSVTRLAIQ